MDGRSDAWDRLYSTQPRPWRGNADLSWAGIPPGSKVLDLGCGNGKSSGALISMGCDVTGLDISDAAVRICRGLYPAGTFLKGDAADLPFEDGCFDAVLSVHCIEHLGQDECRKAVSEQKRVLAHDGILCLQVFGEGDFRSRGKKEDVRNGILYRYMDEDGVRNLLDGWTVISLGTVRESTRFGEERVRIRCVARRRPRFCRTQG